MAPLQVAVQTKLLSSSPQGGKIYAATIDHEWAYDNFPHGGYVLAVISDACLRFQNGSPQPDIINLSVNFLSSVKIGQCTVHIKVLKSGASFTFVEADLYQNKQAKVACVFIFGILEAGGKTLDSMYTIPIGSQFSRTNPISLHPCRAKISPNPPQANFKHYTQWAFDPKPFSTNRKISTKTNNKSLAESTRQALSWGAWFDFRDSDFVLSQPVIAFFSDIFFRLPDLFAAAQGLSDRVNSSYTTLSLNVQFITPLSRDASYSRRSVGLYSTGKHLRNGLFDSTVEIWSSPGPIGEGHEVEGWRGQSVPLAIASQVTIAHPLGLKGVGKVEAVPKL